MTSNDRQGPKELRPFQLPQFDWLAAVFNPTAVASIYERINNALALQLKSLAPFVEVIQAFPKVVRTCSIELAALGWFYDMELGITAFYKMSDWAKSGDIGSIDELLVSHFAEREAEIQQQLLLTFVDRAPALEQAFKAASLELYFAAVPVLLAQVDGIAMHRWGGKFFKSENKRPEVANSLLTPQLDEYQRGYLAAFGQNSGFNAGAAYERDFPHSPNRHAIMHGLNLDYGTRLNYYKALSLLNFVALVVPGIVEEPAGSSAST
jgi:hypothetical protein